MSNFKVLNGNMLEIVPTLEENSFDSCITDPPYELGFMGKQWDSSGVAFQAETWKEVYRVLKPGGYLLAFGGSRTYHRIACAIEDAGFEIRDCIMWLYGSGFPKSMNIGKAMESKLQNGSANKKDFKKLEGTKVQSGDWGISKMSSEQGFRPKDYCEDKHFRVDKVDYKNEIAKQWSGWGTALKPAYEPIIVARKPLKGSCIDNVIKYGVGGINIDECRVPLENNELIATNIGFSDTLQSDGWGTKRCITEKTDIGRFPANVITDGSEEVAMGMHNTKEKNGIPYNYAGKEYDNKSTSMFNGDKPQACSNYNDGGSAMRYFYSAKASKKDRNEGLDDFEEKTKVYNGKSSSSSDDMKDVEKRFTTKQKNIHPTVKPTALMQYLIRLVTPKGGKILDPFAGSGSTGKAAIFENKERDANYFITMVELTPEYIPIIQARCEFAENFIDEKE